jgi:hypothetical protein
MSYVEASNSKFNYSKTEKRPDTSIGGPAGVSLFGSLFGRNTFWNCCHQSREKVKNGQMNSGAGAGAGFI